jgi:hypothetical protein
MRRLIATCCLAAMAAGCARAPASPAPVAQDPAVVVLGGDAIPRPYAMVTAGLVHAVVPRAWESEPIGAGDFPRQGIVASPDIALWDPIHGTVPGVEAEWIDVAHGGIPSDFYYLAARGPAIPLIARSTSCQRNELQVIVNHRPDFAGRLDSPSDYAVHGTGTCQQGDGPGTRYAYFVAAPGYGPVRDIGIPGSGLYVVLAVVKNGPDASKRLHALLMSARFDTTPLAKLFGAAKRSAQLR